MALLIMYLSLAPSNSFNKVAFKIPHLDKMVHFVMYFALMSVIVFENRKWIKEQNHLFYISLIPFFYGIVMEIVQTLFTTSRSGSFSDIIFNTLGVIFSVAVWLYVKPIRKHLLK
jgi:VanZ family protein